MTAPVVTGATLGIAYFAVRNNLITLLRDYDLGFEESILLGYLIRQGPVPRTDLVAYTVDNLKADPQTVVRSLDSLIEAGLAAGEDTVSATERGAEVQREITERVAPITAQVFADLDPDDLAATARILAILTERANAMAG